MSKTSDVARSMFWSSAFSSVGVVAAITCGIIFAGISPWWYLLLLLTSGGSFSSKPGVNRNDVLDEAAAACAKESERFKHTKHADGLGMGDAKSEYACARCAERIRDLRRPDKETP